MTNNRVKNIFQRQSRSIKKFLQELQYAMRRAGQNPTDIEVMAAPNIYGLILTYASSTVSLPYGFIKAREKLIGHFLPRQNWIVFLLQCIIILNTKYKILQRGMLKTFSIIHWVKLLQLFAQYTRDQQVSPCNHTFILIILSIGCKEIPVSLLYAEKMAEVVLLNVLWIGFSASPLVKD